MTTQAAGIIAINQGSEVVHYNSTWTKTVGEPEYLRHRALLNALGSEGPIVVPVISDTNETGNPEHTMQIEMAHLPGIPYPRDTWNHFGAYLDK